MAAKWLNYSQSVTDLCLHSESATAHSRSQVHLDGYYDPRSLHTKLIASCSVIARRLFRQPTLLHRARSPSSRCTSNSVPQIVARRVDVGDAPTAPLPDAGRQLLLSGQRDGAVVDCKHRRVRLACGDHVLSEADNWYLPECLTPAQNRQLEETDTPFGVAVRALGFRRRTLSARLVSTGSGTHGHESMGAASPTTATPAHILQHTAVLSTATGRPFSYLVETYTGEALIFPKAQHQRQPRDDDDGWRESVCGGSTCVGTPPCASSRSSSDCCGAE